MSDHCEDEHHQHSGRVDAICKKYESTILTNTRRIRSLETTPSSGFNTVVESNIEAAKQVSKPYISLALFLKCWKKLLNSVAFLVPKSRIYNEVEEQGCGHDPNC